MRKTIYIHTEPDPSETDGRINGWDALAIVGAAAVGLVGFLIVATILMGS